MIKSTVYSILSNKYNEVVCSFWTRHNLYGLKCMTPKQIEHIEDRLQYAFANKELLVCAFTHSSYAKIFGVTDNERMEFLGDAILDMVVSEYLFGKYVDCDAGVLSTMRSNIVSAKALRPIVKSLDLITYLQVGNGALDIKNDSSKIESNLYEAIVAAIFIDGGIGAVRDFILRTLSKLLNEATQMRSKDSKTVLQEYCQKHKLPMPTYKLAERTGADNNPTYKYDLYLGDEYKCSGQGSSIKTAEQDAAKELVTEWRID